MLCQTSFIKFKLTCKHLHPTLQLAYDNRFRVPEGFPRPLPSVADGGAAPTPHHLRLRIWKRKESGAVLEVGTFELFFCDKVAFEATYDEAGSEALSSWLTTTIANCMCQQPYAAAGLHSNLNH
jgi:hypothetical protein